MKKLSLKNLNFNSIEKLQREELKTLLGGGYGGGGGHSGLCSHYCNTIGSQCTINGRNGVCREFHCDGVRTRLCDAPL